MSEVDEERTRLEAELGVAAKAIVALENNVQVLLSRNAALLEALGNIRSEYASDIRKRVCDTNIAFYVSEALDTIADNILIASASTLKAQNADLLGALKEARRGLFDAGKALVELYACNNVKCGIPNCTHPLVGENIMLDKLSAAIAAAEAPA